MLESKKLNRNRAPLFLPALNVHPAKKKPGSAGHIFKSRESSMDAFLKMIDDLQTPKHKTNHINTEDAFPKIKNQI